MKASMQASDFTDWRFVNFTSGAATAYNQIATIRGVASNANYPLRVPRLGFFNTLAFQLKYPTNVDNDFRVTASQTLIVALNKIFEAGDPTVEPADLSALDTAHAPRGSSCFACHRLLDPIRETFRTTYNTEFVYSNGAGARTPGFAFAGYSGPSANIPELADTLSKHPAFASGWVGKICQYANAQACDETSAEFQRIATAFRTSGYNFRTLVAEVLSSPLVTEKTVGTTASPGVVSASRRDQICQALNTRYRQVLTAKSRTYNLAQQDVCRVTAIATGASSAIATETTSRGSAGISLSPELDPFSIVSTERLCNELAVQMVTNTANRGFDCCGAEQVNESINNMVQFIMGLPANHPRNAAARERLASFYQGVTTGTLGLTPLNGLRQTFVFACSSPDVTGIGL